jgi:hypothetical protein
MYEVTKDNYHMFLTYNGMHPESAEWVVRMYDNTENYHNLLSVKLWVEASKFVLGINK